jgi:hypothetical protein
VEKKVALLKPQRRKGINNERVLTCRSSNNNIYCRYSYFYRNKHALLPARLINQRFRKQGTLKEMKSGTQTGRISATIEVSSNCCQQGESNNVYNNGVCPYEG